MGKNIEDLFNNSSQAGFDWAKLEKELGGKSLEIIKLRFIFNVDNKPQNKNTCLISICGLIPVKLLLLIFFMSLTRFIDLSNYLIM